MASANRHGRLTAVGVLLLFSVVAYAVSPFSPKPGTVLVPGLAQLDAMQSTLLIATGMDVVSTRPLSFYDMDILYPDHNQRRLLEPFLGPVLVGLPLRLLFHLSDVDVFQTIRWLLSVAGLIYGFLLLRLANVDAVLSFTGAVLCVVQPMVLIGNERLQFLSVPLVLPVLYHFLRLWNGAARWPHSVGFAVFATLIPLFSLVNAVTLVVAVALAMPLLVSMLATLRREGRLSTILLPLGLAAVCVAIVLKPWLADRADVAPYSSHAFLQIKHWNPLDLPAGWADVSDFVLTRIGAGLLAGLIVWLGLAAVRRRLPAQRLTPGLVTTPRLLWLAPVAAIAIATVAARLGTVPVWMTLAFHAACYTTLAMFWIQLWQLPLSPIASRAHSINTVMTVLAGGLGVLVCLCAFAPTYVSNPSPLATDLLHRLLVVFPPMRAVREFYRMWMTGFIFLSLFVVLMLNRQMRGARLAVRAAVAAVILIGVGWSVVERPLSASDPIEAPRDVVALASQSLSRGAVYVHPLMRWDAESCVLMMATARALKRPLVNGCLGLIPPWFPYATRVLHRFPDAESLWLLRRWRVETVVNLDTDRVWPTPDLVSRIVSEPGGSVFEIQPPEGPSPHPSGPATTAGDLEQVAASWSRAPGGLVWRIDTPRAMTASAIQVTFSLAGTVIDQIPSAITVSSAAGGNRPKLNAGASGSWLESLAADALIHRQSPVATIVLAAPTSTPLYLEFVGAEAPPLGRIVVIGRRRE